MILGYTLTNIPQKLNTNKRNTNKRTNQLHRIASRRTVHKFHGQIWTSGFLHRKETTEQNKEGGNLQPSR